MLFNNVSYCTERDLASAEDRILMVSWTLGWRRTPFNISWCKLLDWRNALVAVHFLSFNIRVLFVDDIRAMLVVSMFHSYCLSLRWNFVHQFLAAVVYTYTISNANKPTKTGNAMVKTLWCPSAFPCFLSLFILLVSLDAFPGSCLMFR